MNTITVQVSRGSEKHSEFQTFEVPEQENQTVLDLVTYIQEYIESDDFPRRETSFFERKEERAFFAKQHHRDQLLYIE